MSTEIEDGATETVKRRYDRIAPIYDRVVQTAERGRFKSWRSLLWNKAEGKEILEVGAGTGLNFLYADAINHNLTAIDLSDGMLRYARQRMAKAQIKVELLQMDVQNLHFQDDSFDSVIGSFLFCSVSHPLTGLKEVKRVCKPGGKVVLLEHGLSENRVIGALMNAADPIVAWVTGAEHINRKIEEGVVESGLRLENITKLDRTGIFKLLEARKI
ncbi:MAG: methyltransferase domain-containing protein [Dehalococcoidales bacterium]|nr:methyltransferase domain-containing protein [Dehalococcoidales bacterium]